MKIIENNKNDKRVFKVEYEFKVESKKHQGLFVCYRLVKKNEKFLKKIRLDETGEIGFFPQCWKYSGQEFLEEFQSEEEFFEAFIDDIELDRWTIVLQFEDYTVGIDGFCNNQNVSCIVPKDKEIEINEILDIEN